ncbi:MAG: nucleotidyltransferase [Candidatus Omnitrophica bacterium]|nr:nucleotidyltransferase [Candidatus Omnitrophota bacterium]
MTADEYLQSMIIKYRISAGQGSPAYNAGNIIYPIIQKWATTQLREVRFSGSNAKGTAIRGVTDVDLFISLKSDTTNSLKEIFEAIHDWMIKNGYPNARKQNVSIHVNHNGIEIDLVPAVHFGGNTEDHWLYVNKVNRERIKTNVYNHVDVVSNSGRLNEIIITKIWRKNHSLDFPSFYLELVVIEALKYKRSGLADNFSTVLDYLSTNFLSVRFVDPANTNNIISDDLTGTEKNTIATQAGKSRREKLWGSIVW